MAGPLDIFDGPPAKIEAFFRFNPKLASTTDTWFAWRPVRRGALGTGRWVWLRRVWRNRCMGATIYQDLD